MLQFCQYIYTFKGGCNAFNYTSYAVVGFGEAPRGHPASPKSLLAAGAAAGCPLGVAAPAARKEFFGGLLALQTTCLAGDRISRVIRAIQAGIAFLGFFIPHEGSRWSHLHHARKDKFAKGKALARAPLQPPCSGVVLTLQTGSDSL